MIQLKIIVILFSKATNSPCNNFKFSTNLHAQCRSHNTVLYMSIFCCKQQLATIKFVKIPKDFSMAKVTLLHPATFKLDGGAMFGIIPKPLWEKKISADEFNRINMSLRVVLIQDGDRNILVDTGIGDYHGEKFEGQFDVVGLGDHLPTVLQSECGLKPEDITDIILTHLHFDHVGGLGKGNDPHEPVFPNAMIHVHKKHLEYSLSATDRDKGSFHKHLFWPLLEAYDKKNQLNQIEGEFGEIIPEKNIKFKVSFGHTPWMVHPIFENYIYMADLVPMGHHVNVPWVMGYDIEPGRTTEYKKLFYEFIMENDLTMIFEHDTKTWGGKLGIDPKKNKYFLAEPLPSEGKPAEPL
jgi:glyoxylase-like metal-dependent hydrolase (beta-lactamase superfamily II)